MKKLLIGTVVVLALAAMVFAGVRSKGRDKGTKVYAEEVTRRSLTQVVKASGEIDPRVKVNISAHVVGKIEKLYVEEGDRIQAGQPFLQLEREAYLAQRDQWSAQLRSSQTAVRQAEVRLADARQKLERAKRLSTEGILSTETLEGSQLAETSARLQLDESHEMVQQMKANLDKAQDDLSKTTIYAPLSGHVIALNAEEGEVVVSGTMNNPGSVIGIIADLSEILAQVDVDETEIVNVKAGQEAVLKVDAIPGREYHGRVVEVGSSGFNRPQQPDVTFYQVKILLRDADAELRAGMSVRAEIQTAAHADVAVAPIQAVVERPPVKPDGEEADDDEEIKVVFVVEDGKARQRPVETGISDETHVELRSGVKPGEQAVTGPYRTLRDLKDGDAVSITKPTEKEEKADRGRTNNRNNEDEDDQEEE
ncbi:MAG TPA: efflux RND transporter periplasmic adaptor subunit [Thermoanaerobaculia bacterium]|nr:efflux RND transporter periplasmic adaptor subunit [Thermoanaerobaculia bacterium]